MNLSPETARYLARFAARRFKDGTRMLDNPFGRRYLTRLEPRLFALVYLRHHLAGAETGGVVSFSEAHREWYDHMLGWVKPQVEPKTWRHAYVAPRASAKSTTWFLVAPLWAAAHRHSRFVAAFADSASQAEGHLTTLKRELDTNELLRKDYPELCEPAVREGRGVKVADNRAMMQQRNGFVFAAKGVDSSALGMKVGEKRPDLIILDDVEPDASNYSAHLVGKRLATIQNALLPLNEWARVVLVGTVTMDGSLIHQLVRSTTTSAQPAQWITDERFVCHYYPALTTGDDGEPRSLWPEKWSVEYLESIKHTRSFALNYQNHPVPLDGTYWSAADIEVVHPGDDVLARCRHLISIDPAVTSKQGSDYTGIAVLSHDKVRGHVHVRDCWRVRLDPKSLRTRVAAILEQYPEVRVLLVETNQGGDLWADVFSDLPVKVMPVAQSVKKEVRAGWLLNGYQRRAVSHAKPLPDLDSELLGFPAGLHDDQVDAVGSGYTFLTGAGQQRQAGFSGRTV